MDVDGPGSGNGETAADFRSLPGQRRVDVARQTRGLVHALPPGAPRRRSHRRGLRGANVDRLRPGRESAALPESAAADAHGEPARLNHSRSSGLPARRGSEYRIYRAGLTTGDYRLTISIIPC